MTAINHYENHPYPPLHAPTQGFNITPDDAAELPFVTRYIFVGGGGNIVLVTSGADDLTLYNVQPGTEIRISARQIKADGTTATNMVGLY